MVAPASLGENMIVSLPPATATACRSDPAPESRVFVTSSALSKVRLSNAIASSGNEVRARIARRRSFSEARYALVDIGRNFMGVLPCVGWIRTFWAKPEDAKSASSVFVARAWQSLDKASSGATLLVIKTPKRMTRDETKRERRLSPLETLTTQFFLIGRPEAHGEIKGEVNYLTSKPCTGNSLCVRISVRTSTKIIAMKPEGNMKCASQVFLRETG